MNIINIDHIVLTVTDVESTARFYESTLGMIRETSGAGRVALTFGNQKINLHEYGKEFNPRAAHAVPGSEDLCFITDTKLEIAMDHVRSKGIKIVEGPVTRTGAAGKIVSFYFRDPDGNLIEVANRGRGPK